jgi:hypothetical protein
MSHTKQSFGFINAFQPVVNVFGDIVKPESKAKKERKEQRWKHEHMTRTQGHKASYYAAHPERLEVHESHRRWEKEQMQEQKEEAKRKKEEEARTPLERQSTEAQLLNEVMAASAKHAKLQKGHMTRQNTDAQLLDEVIAASMKAAEMQGIEKDHHFVKSLTKSLSSLITTKEHSAEHSAKHLAAEAQQMIHAADNSSRHQHFATRLQALTRGCTARRAHAQKNTRGKKLSARVRTGETKLMLRSSKSAKPSVHAWCSSCDTPFRAQADDSIGICRRCKAPKLKCMQCGNEFVSEMTGAQELKLHHNLFRILLWLAGIVMTARRRHLTEAVAQGSNMRQGRRPVGRTGDCMSRHGKCNEAQRGAGDAGGKCRTDFEFEAHRGSGGE